MRNTVRFIIDPEPGKCRIDTKGFGVSRRVSGPLSTKLRSYGYIQELVDQNFGSSCTWLLSLQGTPTKKELEQIVMGVRNALGDIECEFYDSTTSTVIAQANWIKRLQASTSRRR